MRDEKPIDLQKHVSPKAPRSYLIRIVVYAALIAGCIFMIYFFRDQPKQETPPKDQNSVEEIRNFDIDTTSE
ncbi:MAG: hypothetical protein NXI10_00070 [bacterium]|nr:hypothetical protein [bacterium]